MSLPLTLPVLNNPSTTKDRVFIILSRKYPLSLIELKNQIKEVFNITVSFQSVRKAVLQLVKDNVLEKQNKKFAFSQDWILSFLRFGSILQEHYFSTQGNKSKIEIGQDVTQYTLNSLIDMDFVWNILIRKAVSEKNYPKVITFRSIHLWFILATLVQESELMKEMIAKGIKIYYICYGNTKLDAWVVDMYEQVGVHCMQLPKPDNFDENLFVGSYGNLVIRSHYPESIVKNMNKFFNKYTSPAQASLTEISELASTKGEFLIQSIHSPIIVEGMITQVKQEFIKAKYIQKYTKERV